MSSLLERVKIWKKKEMSNQYLAQTEKQYQAKRVGNKYQTNDQTKNLKHFDRAKKKGVQKQWHVTVQEIHISQI